MIRKLSVVALAVFVVSSSGNAQGALSLQGLGFPPGELSTRAEGTGGAVADFDALSVASPASIAGVTSAALFLQYAPEFRRVTAGSGSAKTTTARFPLIAAIIPMGSAWTLGFSSSTFLDRSYATSAQQPQQVGDTVDIVEFTERTKVLGAINDLRVALAWRGSPKFSVGVGGHIFTGGNRVTFDQIFPDSAKYVSTSQNTRVSFTGFAGSLGIEYHPSRTIGFALSGRKGGELRAEAGDSAIGSGRLPDHFSTSVTYDGITGASLSARVAHDSWSSLGSLSSSNVQAFDGWDASVGAEASGPRILQRLVMLRAGTRFRTLPFGFNGEKVSETAFMAGFGAPLTRDRASFDFAIQRAVRSGSGDAKERGLILSFGLRVSP